MIEIDMINKTMYFNDVSPLANWISSGPSKSVYVGSTPTGDAKFQNIISLKKMINKFI